MMLSNKSRENLVGDLSCACKLEGIKGGLDDESRICRYYIVSMICVMKLAQNQSSFTSTGTTN
jgi:hypothetical protein